MCFIFSYPVLEESGRIPPWRGDYDDCRLYLLVGVCLRLRLARNGSVPSLSSFSYIFIATTQNDPVCVCLLALASDAYQESRSSTLFSTLYVSVCVCLRATARDAYQEAVILRYPFSTAVIGFLRR